MELIYCVNVYIHIKAYRWNSQVEYNLLKKDIMCNCVRFTVYVVTKHIKVITIGCFCIDLPNEEFIRMFTSLYFYDIHSTHFHLGISFANHSLHLFIAFCQLCICNSYTIWGSSMKKNLCKIQYCRPLVLVHILLGQSHQLKNYY